MRRRAAFPWSRRRLDIVAYRGLLRRRGEDAPFRQCKRLASRRRTVSDPTIEGTAGSAGFAGHWLAYRAVRIDVALIG